MVRTQVQLDDEQFEQLKRLASAEGVSMAELIRRGVEAILSRSDRGARHRDFLAALGTMRGANVPSDLAVNHDKYLNEGDRW